MTDVVQPGALVVLQQPVLAAEVAVAEAAVPGNALRLVLAVLEGASNLLRRHISGAVGWALFGSWAVSWFLMDRNLEAAQLLSRVGVHDENRGSRQASETEAEEEGDVRLGVVKTGSQRVEVSVLRWRRDEVLGKAGVSCRVSWPQIT